MNGKSTSTSEIFKLNASLINIEDEDAFIITFVPENIEMDQYFTISCGHKERNPHIELNSQLYGVYDGVEKLTLTPKKITIILNKKGVIALNFTSIEITILDFDLSFEILKNQLSLFFGKKFAYEEN
jgi:hypothetical protein